MIATTVVRDTALVMVLMETMTTAALITTLSRFQNQTDEKWV